MKSLLLILSLLLATSVWGEEQEDAIELTCQLGFAFVQFHLENDENKSWYKFLRESNEYLIEQLKKRDGTIKNLTLNQLNQTLMGEVWPFFLGYKKRRIDDYFDVPHYRIRLLRITEEYIRVFYRPVSKKQRTQNLTINRLTGEIQGRGKDNCKSGLLSELSVYPTAIERKF